MSKRGANAAEELHITESERSGMLLATPNKEAARASEDDVIKRGDV
jgi:hypothetical protein